MLKRIFTNERTVMAVIIANAVIIFLQECGFNSSALDVLDIVCTLFFVVEAVTKIRLYSWKNYWTEGWNRLDFCVVMISLPSVLELLMPVLGGFEALQTLRVLRIMKFFRTFRFFPDFSVIVSHFRDAIRKSVGIMCSFMLLIIIVALLCTSVLKELAPQYFGSVWKSVYTIFRMCTVEGWYEVPDAIAAVSSPFWGGVAKLFFCMLLVLGGIIGLSLINSIFVDEMVSDNNDDIKAQLGRIEQQLKELNERMDNQK